MNIKAQLVVLAEICKQDLDLISSQEKISKLSQNFATANKEALSLKESINSLNQKKSLDLNKKKELDLKVHEEKANLRKWESRAEKIRGERDYTALISEISSQKKVITGLEAQIHELSEELKKVDLELKNTTLSHEKKIDMATLAHDSVSERLEEEKKHFSAIEKAKEALLTKIPVPLKLKYQKILEKRANQGVAFLVDEVCQACRRKLPPELYNKIMKAEIIEQCPSCMRFLVPPNVPKEQEL